MESIAFRAADVKGKDGCLPNYFLAFLGKNTYNFLNFYVGDIRVQARKGKK